MHSHRNNGTSASFLPQPAFTCLKSTMETAEQCVKSVQSSVQIVASDKVSALLLVLLQKEDFLEDYMEDT